MLPASFWFMGHIETARRSNLIEIGVERLEPPLFETTNVSAPIAVDLAL